MGLPPQPRRRFLLSAGCATLVCVSSIAQPHTRQTPAPTPWEQAVHARETFESTGEKTKAAFTAVLDNFRAIYHDNPRDLHAPEAVNAVAQLLAEQGRVLNDEKSLQAAIGQYEFLRKQYPTSSLRSLALLAEAQIEQDDLHDPEAAHDKYAELLKESPRSTAAGEARVALAEAARTEQHTPKAKPETATATTATPASETTTPVADVQPSSKAEARVSEPKLVDAPHSHGPLALVTGIRHWSTPTYTRVAIDLGGEVTFQGARVPHPDRIYFDLHGAKLTSELTGKSFNVTDDGFLKRIRAAQDSSDVTRVVLDVSEVADYSAFLLPNPYRLIIDIHGAKPTSEIVRPATKPDPIAEAPVAPTAVLKASAAADTSGLPAMAPTNGLEASQPAANPHQESRHTPNHTTHPEPETAQVVPLPRTGLTTRPTAARPVPNTVETRSPATTAEVAQVSLAPGREEATSRPTSKPIASTPAATSRRSRHKPAPAEDPALPARAAARTADGETSLTRALGLGIGRIVIDPGHGGHDSGTLGVDGIEEKDVVLDVALRLGKLLHDRLGAEIIYTRSDDTFIPLETRTAIANKAQADLFLSIHANSSSDSTARGVETYYLNFTSDPSALDVAARENAVSGQSIHQLSSLVKKIALKDKIDESREFAADVESSLFTGLEHGNTGLKDRGVKKAPFVVLIGANMPSILAEISFVTNPRDADQLRQPDYRQRVAESLFRGVNKYEQGLAASPPPTEAITRAAVH